MQISKLPKANTVNDDDLAVIVQNCETKSIKRKDFVGVQPDNLSLNDNVLQLTAKGEAVGNAVSIPKPPEIIVDQALNPTSANPISSKGVADYIYDDKRKVYSIILKVDMQLTKDIIVESGKYLQKVPLAIIDVSPTPDPVMSVRYAIRVAVIDAQNEKIITTGITSSIPFDDLNSKISTTTGEAYHEWAIKQIADLSACYLAFDGGEEISFSSEEFNLMFPNVKVCISEYPYTSSYSEISIELGVSPDMTQSDWEDVKLMFDKHIKYIKVRFKDMTKGDGFEFEEFPKGVQI